MAGAVDSGREPARNAQPATTQIASKLLSCLAAASRRAATTDYRELRSSEQRVLGPFDPERERRVRRFGEPRRIAFAAESHERTTRARQPCAPARLHARVRCIQLGDRCGRK